MITYKEALDLLKTERPVYYNDQKKRKITGVTWRRDPDCIYATAEVLDESTSSVSIAKLDKIVASKEESESIDSSEAMIKINELIGILENMKSCFTYEDVEMAKDTYNKLMRGCITLDEEIMSLSNGIYSRDTNDLDYINQIYEDFDDETEEVEACIEGSYKDENSYEY